MKLVGHRTSAPPPSRRWWWRTAASRWQDYQRHNTRQAEKVLEFLERMETRGRPRRRARPHLLHRLGRRAHRAARRRQVVQEVVAVAACVETPAPRRALRLRDRRRGHEDDLLHARARRRTDVASPSRSSCSRRAAAAPAPSSRRRRASSRCRPSAWPTCPTPGMSLHKVSSKCGIFAETDANTLVKTGVPVEEIIASLFEAVVYQNLATLTKGNTPMPEVLLLGGPNLFFAGLQEAWRHHLTKLWAQRRSRCPRAATPRRSSSCRGGPLLRVPRLRRDRPGRGRRRRRLRGQRASSTGGSTRASTSRRPRTGAQGARRRRRGPGGVQCRGRRRALRRGARGPAPSPARWRARSCSAATSAAPPPRRWCCRRTRELLFSCYALSKGNPIEDAQSLFRQVRAAGFEHVGGLALTGYGKDLLGTCSAPTSRSSRRWRTPPPRSTSSPTPT